MVSASLEGGEVVDLAFDPETGLLREAGYLTDAPAFGDAAVRWRFGDYREVGAPGLFPHAYGVSV
ncbi:MAG: hypothetical protein GWO00_02045, partial [Gemmatimonadetes bacterium]|nr:hypothetical protein [Gemmatimonadota bacterium]NIR77208.1 hypothetical protein [Gemmatimonadota bacterium]NIU34600.1 hypothetical protein [Gemmatimonadota bacterium]NIV59969.1 hypothetical protein [Gemmatimonadota bacterium]NIV81531.1 hypothetical protein [Gemmatimonadota bacterium]